LETSEKEIMRGGATSGGGRIFRGRRAAILPERVSHALYGMARGWESKSVESQIEERREAPARRDGDAAAAEELSRRRKRESVELSRRRVVKELETSRSAVHRTALENALHHLDDELRRIDED
jgi:hypothetical protein